MTNATYTGKFSAECSTFGHEVWLKARGGSASLPVPDTAAIGRVLPFFRRLGYRKRADLRRIPIVAAECQHRGVFGCKIVLRAYGDETSIWWFIHDDGEALAAMDFFAQHADAEAAMPQPLIMDDATVELIAYSPYLRSVRDLEPGWWFVRVRYFYLNNDPGVNGGDDGEEGDWFMMLLTGNNRILLVADTLGGIGDYAEPYRLSWLLAQDDADERVQVAGPIRPPEGR